MVNPYTLISDIEEKLNTAQSLSDDDVKLAIEFYSDLVLKLEALGSKFFLAATEARRRQQEFWSIKNHRNDFSPPWDAER